MTPKSIYLPHDLAANRHAVSSRLVAASDKQIIAAISLSLIVLLGVFLRFYALGANSIGNAYYAATVQSMLTSWSNFFFAAFEPGGSVTVDKPPLGFWAQAVSAYFLGVNGFALALPQALAGILSIPLLYGLVRPQFGRWAGLLAALVLATMPITIATERNNTIDGLLLFTMLLAAWAFWRATRLGQFRYALLGAVLVGLGFNIKMLQAFMPLPAFYALYLLGAPHSWPKRMAHLLIVTLVLLAVSLSWAVIVDLTPPEQRPYIGSSRNNSVMELIVGHNGLSRLGLGGGPPRPDQAGPASPGGRPARPLPPPPPPGQAGLAPPDGGPAGALPPPPAGPPPGLAGQLPPGQQPSGPGGDGPGGARGPQQEVGQPGLGRFFREPLATQASWLLPLALLGLPLAGLRLGRPWPLPNKHLALVLWGSWLLPELVYFSFTSGLFHTYYLIMLGPPLAALVGATGWALWHLLRQRHWSGWLLLILLTGLTLILQGFILSNYPGYSRWLLLPMLGLWIIGLTLLALLPWPARSWSGRLAMTLVFASLLIAPLVWSGVTTFNPHPDVGLPYAGPLRGQPRNPNAFEVLSPAQQTLLDYLLARTNPDGYLLATLNAPEAAPYILATQRPVLTFGGFSGRDDIIDAEQLARMVAGGELRFVLGPLERKPELQAWVSEHCPVVTLPGLVQPQPALPRGSGPGQPDLLYDCSS